MNKKAVIKYRRDVYSYCIHHGAAWHTLEMARKEDKGKFDHSLSSMLFSAFSLEAYLNHLGTIEFNNWIKIERNLNPKKKLSRLVEKHDFSPDFNLRPFESFDEIVQFRNKVVHAKTERLRLEVERDVAIDEEPEMLLTEWEEMITLDNAQRFFEDVTSMILILHPKFGFKRDPFWTSWESSWEINWPKPTPDMKE